MIYSDLVEAKPPSEEEFHPFFFGIRHWEKEDPQIDFSKESHDKSPPVTIDTSYVCSGPNPLRYHPGYITNVEDYNEMTRIFSEITLKESRENLSGFFGHYREGHGHSLRIQNDFIYVRPFTLGALAVVEEDRTSKACLMTLNRFVMTEGRDWKEKIVTLASQFDITDLILVGREDEMNALKQTLRIFFCIRSTVADSKYARLLDPCMSCDSKFCLLRLAHEALKSYFKTFRMGIPHSKSLP